MRYQNWYHLTPRPTKNQYLQIFYLYDYNIINFSGSVVCETNLTFFNPSIE